MAHHYVNNKEMYEHCKVYHAACQEALAQGKEYPQIPEPIAAAILQIATRMMNNYNFINYTYKDEMAADGVLKCIVKAHRFDPNKSDNPFAFFSQIVWNEAVERIKKERHQTSVKARFIRNKMSDEFISHAGDIEDPDASNAFVEFLRDNDVLVDYYEVQREEKAKERKIHPSLVHRNKTAYPTKGAPKEQEMDVADEFDIFEVSEE